MAVSVSQRVLIVNALFTDEIQPIDSLVPSFPSVLSSPIPSFFLWLFQFANLAPVKFSKTETRFFMNLTEAKCELSFTFFGQDFELSCVLLT